MTGCGRCSSPRTPGHGADVGGSLAHAAHLGRRFVGSLSSRPPDAAEERWAEDQLLPSEVELWRR